MEQGQIETLRSHSRSARAFPLIEAKLEQHLAQTRRQAELLRECLKRHGGEPSAAKTAFGKVTAMIHDAATNGRDELVKNCLMDYAAEHFEIACYKSLIVAAKAAGDNETAKVCARILEEEEEMADWLEQHVDEVTEKFLSTEA